MHRPRWNSGQKVSKPVISAALGWPTWISLLVIQRRALLEQSIDEYPSGFRQSVHVELALCAWLAGDTDAARRHVAASKGGIVEKSRRLLAQAALAKLEGRDADCERDRLLAIKALADASDAGQARLTVDQLEMLRSG